MHTDTTQTHANTHKPTHAEGHSDTNTQTQAQPHTQGSLLPAKTAGRRTNSQPLSLQTIFPFFSPLYLMYTFRQSNGKTRRDKKSREKKDKEEEEEKEKSLRLMSFDVIVP